MNGRWEMGNGEWGMGNDEEGSAAAIRKALADFSIEAVAIGNGTAGRETERFFKKMDLPPSLIVTLVNESGASVYSASDVARKEFPDAFVVAYEGDKRIDVKTARRKTGQ